MPDPTLQGHAPQAISPKVEHHRSEVEPLLIRSEGGQALRCTREGLLHQVFRDVFPTREQDSQAQERHPMSLVRIAKLVLPVVHVHPGRFDHRATRTRNDTEWLPARTRGGGGPRPGEGGGGGGGRGAPRGGGGGGAGERTRPRSTGSLQG